MHHSPCSTVAFVAHPSRTFHHDSYPTTDLSRIGSSTAGKVLAITGGGSALGKQMCHAFAASRSIKIAVLDRILATLEKIKREVHTLHAGAHTYPMAADIAQ